MNKGLAKDTSSLPPTDYYDVLGCSPHSELDQIHTEYRQRARTYHPDKTSATAMENDRQWNQIREAYEVLGNPQTKAQYDRWRSARLPMAFTEWLKTSQAQSMHWSFDYQRSLTDETHSSSSGNETPSNGNRDIYEMFRNYEI